MSDARDLLAQTMKRMRMPEAPIQGNWECSAAALITPHLPQSLRKIPGLLDRFGAVKLTPVEIGIDSGRAVPWTAVLEIQTRPLRDVIAAAVSTNLESPLCQDRVRQDQILKHCPEGERGVRPRSEFEQRAGA